MTTSKTEINGKLLEGLEVDRCFTSSKFGKVIDCSVHDFSDESQDGYGPVSYLRLVDQKGMIHCGLAMVKSRVTPIKFVSVSRLELAAAALSIKVSVMLRIELTIHSEIKEYIQSFHGSVSPVGLTRETRKL